jgi:hypothetical protein
VIYVSRYIILHLDLDINPRGKIEVHESVDYLWSRLWNVDDSLVDSHLKLLSGVLVDERRSVNRILLYLGWKRYGTNWSYSVSLNRFHNLLGRLVDNFIIVSLELDSDSLLLFGFFSHAPLVKNINSERKLRIYLVLTYNLSNHTSAYSLTTLSDSKFLSVYHSNRCN